MRIILHISFIVLLLGVIVSGTGCADNGSATGKAGCEWAETLPESRPADFALFFNYGYSRFNRNELDTFNGTFTKDMGADPSITIDFNLSDEDMDRIYRQMLEIDFFCYPDEFAVPVPENGIVAARDPYLGYYFRVKCGGKVKELRWEDNIQYVQTESGELKSSEEAKKLRMLTGLIIALIESREEYRELPSSGGLIITDSLINPMRNTLAFTSPVKGEVLLLFAMCSLYEGGRSDLKKMPDIWDSYV